MRTQAIVYKNTYAIVDDLFTGLMLLISGLCDGVSSQVRTQAIVDELFTDYKPSQIPICHEENVTVSIDVALRQIMDMVRLDV